MKHFLYLLVVTFIFSSCESDFPEVANTDASQSATGQNFKEIAQTNTLNLTSQQTFIDQQKNALSLTEAERSKALATTSNASEIGNDLYISYNNLGNSHYRNGNYNLALLFYLTSVELKLLASDTEGLALTYRNIALAYEAKGDYGNAAINFWQSYYLYDLLEDASKTAKLLNDLGVVYDLAHDFVAIDDFDVTNSLALGYYTQAIDLNESLNNLSGIEQSEINIELLFETYSEKSVSIASRTDLEPSRDQDDVEDEL